MSSIIDITKRIRSIARSKKYGATLEAAVNALRLDDPDGPLCQTAGTDETGRCRCLICPVSDGQPAGCMKYVERIQSNIAKRNSTKAKIALEALAERLDRADEADPIFQYNNTPTGSRAT